MWIESAPVLNMALLYFLALFGYLSIVHTSSCPCDLLPNALANCSNLALTRVPDCVPNATSILYLNNNNFEIVKTGQFRRFTSLKELHIENNDIRKLEVDSFNGLTYLEDLSLASNCLRYSDSYPDDVFEPLKTLITLRIQGNCNSRVVRNCTYPENALSRATSIEFLYVDGLNGVALGHGFASLKRLQRLQMSENKHSRGYCFLSEVLKNDLYALSNTSVSTIELQNCGSTIIEEGVFSYLRNLSSLTVIGNNEICQPELYNTLSGLNLTKIKSLKLSKWCQKPPYNFNIDLKLSKFLKSTSLEYLELSKMNVGFIYYSFIANLPDTLITLSLKENRIYNAAFCSGLFGLKKIRELDLSAQNLHNSDDYTTN